MCLIFGYYNVNLHVGMDTHKWLQNQKQPVAYFRIKVLCVFTIYRNLDVLLAIERVQNPTHQRMPISPKCGLIYEIWVKRHFNDEWNSCVKDQNLKRVLNVNS